MSRKWVLFLSAVIMLALALVVARVFREPLPPLSGEETAQVGDSVSGPLQAAPQASLPAPLPSPEAMIMSSGESGDLPVTRVEPQVEEPTGVAPVVRDSAFGSAQVTEPPVSSAVPADVKSEAGGKSPSPSPAYPVPETDENQAPAVPVPEKLEPVLQAAPPSASDKPETMPPSAPAGSEGGDKPAPSSNGSAPRVADSPAPAPAAAPAAPSAPDKGGKADKPLKPGTLVTKSSLPAKAGGRVVTAAVLTMDGDVVTLNLQGTSAMRGKTFMLAGPDRVVLDIEGNWKVEAPRVPSNRMVRALRVGSQGAATRLVFDMRVKPVKVKVTNPGYDSLELTIR